MVFNIRILVYRGIFVNNEIFLSKVIFVFFLKNVVNIRIFVYKWIFVNKEILSMKGFFSKKCCQY